MDARRFDSLTLALGSALGRRRFLAMAAGLVAGATATVDVAEAATTCRRGRQTCQRNTQCCSGTCQTGKAFALRDRNRCTCEDGLEVCGNACVDTDTDTRHCGACGNQCGAGDHCIDGYCRIHQECFSDETGLCYMDSLGKEHRADGLIVREGSLVPCTLDANCAGAYDECSRPGVTCACVRAFDSNNGYQVFEDATALCIAMLDSGDGRITCNATSDSECVFTADGTEMRVCEGGYQMVGNCVDYSCDEVEVCTLEGVACTCGLATNVEEFPFYFNIFIGDAPKCFAYSSDAGPCPG